jgi:hypothetical protein
VDIFANWTDRFKNTSSPDTPSLFRHRRILHYLRQCPFGGLQHGDVDESVRSLSYSLDTTMHENLANRKDGNPIDGSKL